MFFTRISCENPKMEKIPENHPFFKNGQFLVCPKKIFQKLFSGIFFKEIKYYKDFVKNEWGVLNILCGWLQNPTWVVFFFIFIFVFIENIGI